MNTHEEILERMSGANPLPDVEMITDGQLAEMTLHIEEARRAEIDSPPLVLEPTKPHLRWLRPVVVFGAALFAAFVVIGVVSLTTGDESEVANEPTSTTTAPLSPDEWNPILATSLAGPPPEPATCPSDTDPTAPGPPDQSRPYPRIDDHVGAFDLRLGKIVYVDIVYETWTFDVCTNTWEQMDALGQPLDTSLVYDIDSDVTIALGPGTFSVYDAIANEWTQPSLEIIGTPVPGGFRGVTYDPISGMVITTHGDGVWAFDVEAASLTRVGPVPNNTHLAGYVAGLDRLVFVGAETVLVDPRNGARTTAAAPSISQFGMHDFFEAGETLFLPETVFVGDMTVCGLDTDTLAWSRCYEDLTPAFGTLSSWVSDPINNRVILTESTSTRGTSSAHDVWALDLDTGSLTEIVAGGVAPTIRSNWEWETLLATTRSAQAPQPATCTAGTQPNEPGPALQQRPTTRNHDLNGAFDRRMGRVMYVDTTQRTWAFDVCNNTWQNLEPEGIPNDGWLIYDVDSDVTLAIDGGYFILDDAFAVYDAAKNTWTKSSVEVVGGPAPYRFDGVTYDPVSGLVLATFDDQVWAYDVGTGTITLIGDAPLGSRLAG
ncbi:MAG: hypothetical protein QNJ89_07860, partial [Acidimicrobiia bacterium]|nr:hypothetical protein [Acidimicrobiia bacterium]